MNNLTSTTENPEELNEIMILNLVSGKNIISEVDRKSPQKSYKLINPMILNMKHNGMNYGIQIDDWFPLSMLSSNVIDIPKSNVITTFQPSNNVIEYYYETIINNFKMLQMNKYLENIGDENEFNDVMVAIEESQGQTLH